MPFVNGRPVLGAALTLKTLEPHLPWLTEQPRDLEIQDFCEIENYDGDWRGRAATLRGLLTGHQGRLGIHGPFWSMVLASRDPDIRAVVTRRLLWGLDVCEALGATQMVTHSPFTTWDFNNLSAGPDGHADVIGYAHETLKPVVARAEEIGVELVIENIEDKDPAARVALARSFESTAVRVSIDTGHAHYAHGSTGAPTVDRYVEAAGDMLAHVHIQDADGYADRHWLPGDGTVNWRAVFAALAVLAKSGTDPRLIIEVKDQVGLARGAAHLVDLGLAV